MQNFHQQMQEFHRHHHHPLTLFIIKKFYTYDGCRQVSNGLRTSAMFVVELLLREGFRAKLVEAIDGNCIDRLVTENRPTRVVLEAIWVTPHKIAELQRLHPGVKWTVRVHSEIPFLANEGMAVKWLASYLKLGVEVAFNSPRTVDDFKVIGPSSYLPNFYFLRHPRRQKPIGQILDVGCFGAIRPLKNQLIQAFAAVRFAKEQGKSLRFHMNGGRIEQNGTNNLIQIKALMEATGQELILHPWLDHEEFLELIARMDICLQVSLSETFNIVSADAASMGVPLVGSDQIPWLPKRSQAKADSALSIASAMAKADETSVILNHEALESYLEKTVVIWAEWASR